MALTRDELTVLQLIATASDRSYESICDRFASLDEDSVDGDDAIMEAQLRFRRTVRGFRKQNFISYPGTLLTAETLLALTNAGDDALEAEA